MKVKAKSLGYYEHKRRREGAEFELLNIAHFSHKWMEAVDFTPPKDVSAGAPSALDVMAKQTAQAYAKSKPKAAKQAKVETTSSEEVI